jgi:hypothetical protein
MREKDKHGSDEQEVDAHAFGRLIQHLFLI